MLTGLVHEWYIYHDVGNRITPYLPSFSFFDGTDEIFKSTIVARFIDSL